MVVPILVVGGVALVLVLVALSRLSGATRRDVAAPASGDDAGLLAMLAAGADADAGGGCDAGVDGGCDGGGGGD